MLIQAWAVGSAPGNSKETPLSKLWEPRVITQEFSSDFGLWIITKTRFTAIVTYLCVIYDSFPCSGEPELGKPT